MHTCSWNIALDGSDPDPHCDSAGRLESQWIRPHENPPCMEECPGGVAAEGKWVLYYLPTWVTVYGIAKVSLCATECQYLLALCTTWQKAHTFGQDHARLASNPCQLHIFQLCVAYHVNHCYLGYKYVSRY